jgi:hypothetical protein
MTLRSKFNSVINSIFRPQPAEAQNSRAELIHFLNLGRASYDLNTEKIIIKKHQSFAFFFMMMPLHCAQT